MTNDKETINKGLDENLRVLVDPKNGLKYKVNVSNETALDRIRDNYLEDIMYFSKKDVASLLAITTKTLDVMIKNCTKNFPNEEFYKTPSGNKRFNKVHIDNLIKCSTLNQEKKSTISSEQKTEDNSVFQRVKQLKRRRS